MEVGSLSVSPAVGGVNGSNPISAEDFAVMGQPQVRFVSAVFTGSNNSVDFNNLGFTVVPEPGTAGLLLGGLLAASLAARRRSRTA